MEYLRRALRPVRVVAGWLCGYDAFISYRRSDAAAYARGLWTDLEKNGLTVVWDRADIQAGETLSVGLAWRIRRSRYLILVDTCEARKSSHVASEVASAIGFGRHIVRICFPQVAGSEPWHCLEPYREQLLHEIWIEDVVDPARCAPSPEAVAELLKKHRTIRVLFWFGVLASCVLLAALTVAMSKYAHWRTDEATRGFQRRELSLVEADAGARRLFGDWLFPVLKVFAGDDLWELRNVWASAHLKRRVIADAVATPAAVPCDGDGVPPVSLERIQPPAVCVAWDGASESAVLAAPPGSRPRAVWTWDTRRGLTPLSLKPRNAFDRIAVSRDRLGVVRGGAVQLIGRDGQTVVEREVRGPRDVAFSDDGRLLAVLSRPKGDRDDYALSLWDAVSGARLDEQAVVLQSSKQPPCPPGPRARLWKAGALLYVCVDKRFEAFEWRPPQDIDYYLDQLDGPYILGASRALVDGAAYFTLSSETVFCPTAARCENGPDGATINADDPEAGGSIRALEVVTPSELRIELTDGTARCVIGLTWRCARSRSSTLERRVPGPSGLITLRPGAGALGPAWANVIAAAAGDRYIEVDTYGGIRLWTSGTMQSISLHQIDRSHSGSAGVTAAAFGDRPGSLAIAVAGVKESAVYVRERTWVPWPATRWRRLPTGGTVLALWFSSADRQVETIERLDVEGEQQMIRRRYRFAPSLLGLEQG